MIEINQPHPRRLPRQYLHNHSLQYHTRIQRYRNRPRRIPPTSKLPNIPPDRHSRRRTIYLEASIPSLWSTPHLLDVPYTERSVQYWLCKKPDVRVHGGV